MFCYYTLAISTEPISFFTGVSRTFFTAEGRFLSVVSSEVMLVMTVVVTVAARRKTCFPTADAVIATKAEPSEDAIGFFVSFIVLSQSRQCTMYNDNYGVKSSFRDLYYGYHAMQSSFRTTKSGFRCARGILCGTGDTYKQPPPSQQSSHCSQMQEAEGRYWWKKGAREPSDYAISQLENAGLAVCGF